MRKYILFLLFLCSLSAARGQTDWKNWHCDYWFDNDLTSLNEVKTCTNGNGSDSFQIEADVSGLSEGLHSINIQALGFSNVITGFEKVKNEDYSEEISKQLSELLHQEVNLEIEDAVVTTEKRNLYSVPVTRYFVKMPELNTARVWFDNDLTTLQTGVKTGEAVMLDIESIKDGFHIINIQAEGADKGLSVTKCYPFVKIPQVLGVDHLTCLCMIDDQLYKQEEVPATGGVVAWQFDVSQLPQGFHRIYVQVVTPSGAASSLYQGFFCRETTKAEFGEMKCVYAIDGGNFDNVAGTLADGTFHFDLDVASLSDGLHRIAYMLSNGKGVTTKVQTQFFTKIPLGGYGTVEYWYWLNNQDGEDIVKVKVDPRKNPFNLLTLLPVGEVPIRSQQFEFRVVAGQPIIYAKNTFHARFYDASGRFVDFNKDFVDERVSEEVDETTLLEAIELNARSRGSLLAPIKTVKGIQVDKPAENAIRWFKMEAEPGDSLQFHLDRAATIQLFAPSGKEVYNVSGAEAVKWGGIHAEETGIYYMAIHDVTATYGSNLTLYYEFIDKYAVLRQDIDIAGNGGPSTINFFGNGFDQLKSVDLVLGTTIIPSMEIGHETNATTNVKFDFNGAPKGQYTAVFHFADEDLNVEKCIMVEEAIDIAFDATVSYAQQFLITQGNKYIYKVANKGNMTAYQVPLDIYVYTPDSISLTNIRIEGFELDDPMITIDTDTIKGHPYLRHWIIKPSLRPLTIETFTVVINTTQRVYVFLGGCGATPIGGGSDPVNSLDPNDIYGYQAESGSKAIKENLTDVFYTIEFENDPDFATASAHDIFLTDTLDASSFDLSTFTPTRVTIGEKSVELDGTPNFLTTIDMRPAINTIAQVEGSFDATKGIAKWHISSLDPMTMEPTTEPMDGVLPVNIDGNGIGQVAFDISLKPDMDDGTTIDNRAGIVFDNNATIMTPTWTSTIDATAPTSSVVACDIKDGNTATLYFDDQDDVSGVWKHDVYVQYNKDGAWTKLHEGVTDAFCDVAIQTNTNHGFYVVATDSAGNVEVKEAAREYTLDLFDNIEKTDLAISLEEGWNWISHNQTNPLKPQDVFGNNVIEVKNQTKGLYHDSQYGMVGNLTELLATEAYKVKTDAADAEPYQLSDYLFNASTRPIELKQGWNWIGYPLAHKMEIALALKNFSPEESDYIIGREGFAEYTDKGWKGTLTLLTPGRGYMYKSGVTRNLFFNAEVDKSAYSEISRRKEKESNPWHCDAYKHPDVMAVTAQLYDRGMVVDANDYIVAAFCGDECRGVGLVVDGIIMMSVYGDGNENITFRAIEKNMDSILNIAESISFTADAIGRYTDPYRLTLGDEATGIIQIASENDNASSKIFSTTGIRQGHIQKGVNIVKKHGRSEKVLVK